MSSIDLRIACVQLSPVFKDVKASIARANRITETIEPDSLDLLILPETAFTGYCFESREDVEPFLEDSTAGPTYHWASAKAAALRCYVLVGFPERAPDDTAYNSMLVVSPSGIVTVYRKHFLYPPADPKWAAEGPGFQTIDLPYLPSHAKHSPTSSTTFRVCLSICMDLSPKEFLAPFDAYELSNFALEHKADVLVCCMAWLDAEPPTLQTEEELRMSDAATPVKTFSEVRSTIGYWAARCAPLIGTGTLFVACNRIGREGDSVFTGSSCIMKLDDPPQVLAYAGKRTEDLVTSAD